MKFADAPKDVQKALQQRRRGRGRSSLAPPNGDLWWDDSEACCEMCGTTGPLVWDHCHATGLIRGRLCYSCNGIEGQSGHPVWEFWRVHAPGFDHREFYYGASPRFLTVDETMTLPIAAALELHYARESARNRPHDELAAKAIGELMFGSAS